MIISVEGKGIVLETNKSLNELAIEDFEAAGWKYDASRYVITMKIKKTVTDPNGKEYTYMDTINVSLDNLTAEITMKYSEYKGKYSECKTKKNTYNAETKEVTVLVPIA